MSRLVDFSGVPHPHVGARVPATRRRFPHEQARVCRTLILLTLMLVVACGGGNAGSANGGPDGDVLNSVSAEELFEGALTFRERGDLQRSEQYFVASMERGKSPTVVIPHLVRLCVSQRRFSGALNYLEPLLQHEPHHWRLRRLYATLLAGLRRNDDAEVEFRRVLAQAPEDPTTHYFVGMFYRDLSRRDEAKTHLLLYLEYTEDARHRAEVEETLLRFEEWDNAEFQAIGTQAVGSESTDDTPSELESELDEREPSADLEPAEPEEERGTP